MIATGAVLAFVGSSMGGLMLAGITGVSVPAQLESFPVHPFLQIFGFLAEFVLGVGYSLLPRFGATSLRSVSLGYTVYVAITTSSIIMIAATVIPAPAPMLWGLSAFLLLCGSAIFLYQLVDLLGTPRPAFPETRPLILLSGFSFLMVSLVLVIQLAMGQAAALGDLFTPSAVYLSLLGFVGSMIYAVSIRSVSFRQSDYRRTWARDAYLAQGAGVGLTFAGTILDIPILSQGGGVLFLIAAVCLVLSIRIFERAHAIMNRSAMTNVHLRIMHYNEACVALAAAWLLLGCLLGVLWQVADQGSFVLKDSFIHAIAIGVVGSAITCFAPMLLPGLLGTKGPVTGLTYGPIALLNVGVLLRIAGDLQEPITRSLPLW